MLKFPNNKNRCISEYISCQILKTLGFNVQETILGTYNVKGKVKNVVACLDFTSLSEDLREFYKLKNSQIDLPNSGYNTELNEILKTIDNQVIYDKRKLKNFFYEMFIADALIGNFERDNDDWGFLINQELEVARIAPIYGCDGSLYPNLTDMDMFKYINDKTILELYLYSLGKSSIKINDKKINYFDYISSLENEDLNKALLKIFPRIDLEKINEIIDSVSVISDVRKKFYKKIIKMRYEIILKFSYDKLTNK